MTTAWVPLATTTLSSATASVTFGSIPSGYRDLSVSIVGKSTNATAQYITLALNLDTTSWTRVVMYGTGSAAGSGTASNNVLANFPTSSQAIGVYTLQIMDYSDTSKHKTVLQRGDAPSAATDAQVLRWANTNAVTSVRLSMAAGNFEVGSTFSLWGSNRL